MVQHLCTQKELHSRERSQAAGDDCHEESRQRTTPSSEDVTGTAEIRCTIKYRPGKEMQLADALSCCPARASQEIKLDMQVDYIAFTKQWIEKLKDSTQRDPILGTVYQLTQQGWPHQ